MIFAIDPGPEESAWVLFGEDWRSAPSAFAKESNDLLRRRLFDGVLPHGSMVVIEKIASYGMPVGESVFKTCVETGRFIERWAGPVALVTRHEVKMHLCKSPRANDATIRQALLDRYGGDRKTACGTKKQPGPLYGVAGDIWAALAVGVTWIERGK